MLKELLPGHHHAILPADSLGKHIRTSQLPGFLPAVFSPAGLLHDGFLRAGLLRADFSRNAFLISGFLRSGFLRSAFSLSLVSSIACASSATEAGMLCYSPLFLAQVGKLNILDNYSLKPLSAFAYKMVTWLTLAAENQQDRRQEY